MFNLIATLKPLGIREDDTPFDLEFPTRNQLKCFLAKQITKQRKQLRQGHLNKDSIEHDVAIISSTDFQAGTAVSSQCKSIYEHTVDGKESARAGGRTPRNNSR